MGLSLTIKDAYAKINGVMKLRSTTPASMSISARVTLFVISAALVATVPFQMMAQIASADKYDDQIKALEEENAAYSAESARLSGEALTLKSAIDQIVIQKRTIQSQIDINQLKYDQLVEKIAETEKKIKDNQDALGTTIANMYVDDNITPLEMLAGSKNISEYMDKQEYRSSVRDELVSSISEIKDLKAQLVTQKAEVETILNSQKSQRDALQSKENEQQNLLAQTNGQEDVYQQLIGKNQDAIAEVRATQALVNSRFNGSGGYTLVDSGALGDYPWNSSNCPMWGYLSTGGADGNGGDGGGYGCRQCASYVAWRIAKETGKYYSWGNAVNFTYNAIAAGYSEGSPQPGSIAVMDPGKAGQSYGHVAWVEAVNGDSVLISQYNYNYGAGYGMYSEMWLSSGAFDHYVKIK